MPSTINTQDEKQWIATALLDLKDELVKSGLFDEDKKTKILETPKGEFHYYLDMNGFGGPVVSVEYKGIDIAYYSYSQGVTVQLNYNEMIKGGVNKFDLLDYVRLAHEEAKKLTLPKTVTMNGVEYKRTDLCN